MLPYAIILVSRKLEINEQKCNKFIRVTKLCF